MYNWDLSKQTVRALNQALHALTEAEAAAHPWIVSEPRGAHSVAVGMRVPAEIRVEGHVGYYCAGMNQQARVSVHGNCGTGVAENMMSGVVRVHGSASQSAGASGHGGLLVIHGDAAARCGISMKGIDIVVRGSVGHLSAFMAQAGNLVVCGDAGDSFGDSIYEARLFVRGSVKSLGTDCVEKEMRPEHLELLRGLLLQAGFDAEPADFRRYGSARKLYHFHSDHASHY